MNKKLLLSLGAIGSIAAPVAAVVACGTTDSGSGIEGAKGVTADEAKNKVFIEGHGLIESSKLVVGFKFQKDGKERIITSINPKTKEITLDDTSLVAQQSVHVGDQLITLSNSKKVFLFTKAEKDLIAKSTLKFDKTDMEKLDASIKEAKKNDKLKNVIDIINKIVEDSVKIKDENKGPTPDDLKQMFNKMISTLKSFGFKFK